MTTDAEKIEAAQKAVSHVLKRMNADAELRYRIGSGTESYELLTKAAATLFDEPLETVQKFYTGR